MREGGKGFAGGRSRSGGAATSVKLAASERRKGEFKNYGDKEKQFEEVIIGPEIRAGGGQAC
jgi:hypothetical protein